MPYPNEHAARLEDPSRFEKETFRRTAGGTIYGRTKVPKTVGIIWAKLKTADKPSNFPLPISLRFPIKNWSTAEAKEWLKENKVKPDSFEAAEPKKENSIGNMIYKSMDIIDCIKSKNDEGEEMGVFTGAMATEDVDRVNDKIAPDAFDESLANYKKSKRRIKLFYQHNVSEPPIGGIDAKNVTKEGKKWIIKGELDFNNPKAITIYSALLKKNLSDLSIGFSIDDYDVDKKDRRIIKKLTLWEVSVVGEPANTKAKIDEVKEYLKKMGLEFPEKKPDDEKEDPKYEDEGEDEEYCTSKEFDKYTLDDVRYFSREEFNTFLSKSGMLTRSACEFLASHFCPNQSKSDTVEVIKFIEKQLDIISSKLNLITKK